MRSTTVVESSQEIATALRFLGSVCSGSALCRHHRAPDLVEGDFSTPQTPYLDLGAKSRRRGEGKK